MRSAFICVFLAFTVHRERSFAADEDFRPTPIPLSDWGVDGKNAGAGTLQEIVATEAPPAVAAAAAVPAHYWEDALRHSVYLTLVRDKIDQLIAKGSVVSPDGKSPDQLPKDVDDHDLWEKIKTAPFDRLNTNEPANLGDITIMAKGRLLDDKSGFRFTEDESSKEKCKEEKCMEGIKAYWSVKRIRQREAETIPGKYHYELTFAVSSQSPKKQLKPYENPVRTFTVREGTPVEKPAPRTHGPPPPPAGRPQRAVWFHKNIAPPPRYQTQRPEQTFDRFFSSLFSSEDDDPPVKRYKHIPYVPHTHPPRSKVPSYVGLSSEQHHHKYASHIHKPQSYKYSRPPLGPPPLSQSQQHYYDVDTIRHQQPFTPPTTDYKHVSSNFVKTTKPAVLPTPPNLELNTTTEATETLNVTESMTPGDNIKYENLTSGNNIKYESMLPENNKHEGMTHGNNIKHESIILGNHYKYESMSTRHPDILTAYTTYSKPKPPPTKVSYFPEHVRPPVFNAPPGVFVTMDKKPFKPMPPMKYLHGSKPLRHNKPVDFRPSPQVLDVQFSDPDPLSDAFRPIAMSYAPSNVTESIELGDSDKVKNHRKSKPPKKHEHKSPRTTTTSAPEIITAQEIAEDINWAQFLAAFTNTPSMGTQKTNDTEATSSMPSSTVSTTTALQWAPIFTEVGPFTATTHKPRRTRPPPTFTKPIKAKKHKRVSTTTTTTTTTEKTTYTKPLRDLTPQASSAAKQNPPISTTPMIATVNNHTENSVTTETSTTTTKVVPTTYRATTTPVTTTARPKTTSTTRAPRSTTETPTTIASAQPKNKNRFRQSTLLLKGTSVKHDKWSAPSSEKEKTSAEKVKYIPPTFAKLTQRRKGSNFHGYVSSTPKSEEIHRREDHVDHVPTHKLKVISLSNSSESLTESVVLSPSTPTQETYESNEKSNESEMDSVSGTEDPYEVEHSEEVEDETDSSEEQDTKDKNEYIFKDTSSNKVIKDSDQNDALNEVESQTITTTEIASTTPHTDAKNKKPKCKNKKNIAKNVEAPKHTSKVEDEVSVMPIESTTEKMSTPDFFEQIFGLTLEQNETDNNRTDSKYADNDDDLEEFLESINEKKDIEITPEEYQDDEKDENVNSPFNNDEENRFPRHADTNEDYQERPYTFLELMAME